MPNLPSTIYLSVVICTYNREKFILSALRSLVNQDLSSDAYEIVIINNNSSDRTDILIKKFMSDHTDFNINYAVEKNQGLGHARNRGIAESQGVVITYIDDDAEAPMGFLSTVVNRFKNNNDWTGIGGKVIPKYETKEPLWMNKFLEGLVTKTDHGEKVFKFSKNYPVGCNMSYRKEYLVKCGGFDTDIKWRADDKYIFFEIKKLTDQIYYVPELWLHHNIDDFRTTKENFKLLSLRTGSEEKFRIKNNGPFSYLFKIIEYTIKFFGSFVLFTYYSLIKGSLIKGKYIVAYRYYALKGLLGHIQ